jgi:dimethylhistidine N-methyltransferase
MTETTQSLQEAVRTEALKGLHVAPGEQKTLSPWLFYDERGSQLFEDITRLDEYYLTRTEREIFAVHARDIVTSMAAPLSFVELGAGSCSKTGLLLCAASRLQGHVLYQPIDVSASALEEAGTSLREKVPPVHIKPLVANYVTEGYRIERDGACRVLALYIGSSIGNFSPQEAREILRTLRDQLQPGDGLLLGTDLRPSTGKTGRKTVAQLQAAYDDREGVTAEFNKNVLARLNRDLDADFDLDAFAHLARWNEAESRIEMHLQSLADQTVRVAGERIRFAAGETIHTENSYKFSQESLQALMKDTGFRTQHTWHDPQRWFAVTLARVE